VTQRGNNQEQVFFDVEDLRTYLDILAKQSRKYEFEVQAYCLMRNHVHVVGIPREDDSLSKAIGRTNYVYTQYVNKRYERSGHLWQSRFFSCPMDQKHTVTAMLYVEQNPVRAGIVRKATQFKFSSARIHCGLDPDDLGLLSKSAAEKAFTQEAWRSMLREPVAKEESKALQKNLKTGRPLGEEAFLDSAEKLLGRAVKAKPVGRPSH
jgi:putative transposase